MTLGISSPEYRQRFAALQQRLRQRDLDALLVTSVESIYYLTGAAFEPLERPFFLLVRSEAPPRLLVPKLDEQHMRKTDAVAGEDVLAYREYPAPAPDGWPHRLNELLDGAKAIGVEPTVRREITDQLTDRALHSESAVDELRRIKSAAEVEMIQRAARYAVRCVQRLLGVSYRGATVAEGFAATSGIVRKIIREVDDWDPLTTKVLMATWAAPRSSMPHSVPQLADRLAAGPHVALALTRVNGYAAECERTYFTAAPSRDVEKMFSAMMQARQIALAMLRPGVACHDIDATVSAFLQSEGYGDQEQHLHRTGHGIGLGNHEPPWLAEGSDDQLAENMVVSIEPGIYRQNVGGVRHSDTVLVTRGGYRLLTCLPTDLQTLWIRQRRPLARLQGHLVRWTVNLRGKHSAAAARDTS